jgi:hypothetical protein
MSITPAQFGKIGEAIYGPSWRAALAIALGVGERTVRRWAAGTSGIPASLPADLAALCRRRSDELAKLAERLENRPY